MDQGKHMTISRSVELLLVWSLALSAAAADLSGPRYTNDGSLILPSEYREWVFLSSGLDMSYTEKPTMQGMSMFDNVFVAPEAWATFKQTGHWPDRTVFVMENRGAATHGSINKLGHFQTTEFMGLELHVRDDARFKGGWGFFASDGKQPAAPLPTTDTCYACHEAHGALDTTFTQFYPTAKGIALAKHSLLEDRSRPNRCLTLSSPARVTWYCSSRSMIGSRSANSTISRAFARQTRCRNCSASRR